MDVILENKIIEKTADETIDLAVRVALAIKTEGVVSAPLEGIEKVIVRDNALGGDKYLSIYFAGPIERRVEQRKPLPFYVPIMSVLK